MFIQNMYQMKMHKVPSPPQKRKEKGKNERKGRKEGRKIIHIKLYRKMISPERNTIIIKKRKSVYMFLRRIEPLPRNSPKHSTYSEYSLETKIKMIQKISSLLKVGAFQKNEFTYQSQNFLERDLVFLAW